MKIFVALYQAKNTGRAFMMSARLTGNCGVCVSRG